jgi:hypothetical protein
MILWLATHAIADEPTPNGSIRVPVYDIPPSNRKHSHCFGTEPDLGYEPMARSRGRRVKLEIARAIEARAKVARRIRKKFGQHQDGVSKMGMATEIAEKPQLGSALYL